MPLNSAIFFMLLMLPCVFDSCTLHGREEENVQSELLHFRNKDDSSDSWNVIEMIISCTSGNKDVAKACGPCFFSFWASLLIQGVFLT